MPNKHKKKSKHTTTETAHDKAHDASAHEAEQIEVTTEDEIRAEEAVEAIHVEASANTAESETDDEVKLAFPYSDLVRAYVPKAMDVADKVATDWKKDGSFMNLGIDNPYANMAVSVGLKKAKELEKKLDEKGVLSVVRMGVEVIKQQVNKKK